ncbi:hypothetical protein [Enhydrobacter sp.]|jgi:hypothetical protein|uniref:hypothetical protein n=1 Tax=Enhydrobacter sp. TaxID=1894999 RepID=UPI002637AA73|nr:hypothetical protein [Enhydrobacter sp.]WIM10318.1 MAG: hypothetical protein OJF58_001273 [Enhydrobacter sp.]
MSDRKVMASLHQAWVALQPRLKILEPVQFSSDHWSLVERMHEDFNDREVHTHLPMPIARFREEARKAIYEHAKQFNGVNTVYVNDAWFVEKFVAGTPDTMAAYVRLFNDDVDEMMGVLIPSARYRKEHYAYGKFTVPEPHGLHTDHSAEDPDAAGEPICIARIETLGTHYVAGDYRAHDSQTRSMLKALRYWVAVPEGEPEAILDELLERETIKTIPANLVMLMVAGNSSDNAQITQHIAARPPNGGLHSAFFQRQYKLI